MKKLLALATIFCLFISLSAYASALQLGEPLTLSAATPISEINKNPEKYIGKRVQIEGLIISVCAARGCWVDIASDVPFEKIQVKVVDGEIVFPMEAKGKMARVEGIAEELKLSKAQALKMAEHLAEEQGVPFDPASITGPTNVYRVRGLGALIQ